MLTKEWCEKVLEWLVNSRKNVCSSRLEPGLASNFLLVFMITTTFVFKAMKHMYEYNDHPETP
jgi:hypothetical protein